MRWLIAAALVFSLAAGTARAVTPAEIACASYKNALAAATDANAQAALLKSAPRGCIVRVHAPKRAVTVEHQPARVRHALPAPPHTAQPVVAQSSQPRLGEVFQDAPDTPEMVVIPAGAFTMGSPASEPGRYSDEGPPHRVTIGYALAVGRYDVTREQFAAFVTATGYRATDNGCYTRGSGGTWSLNAQANWQQPGFDQTATDPVVCVTWDDASAYAAWLSRKTGHSYRLLSEAEWEYAARAGTTTAYWWGDDIGANRANCAGCGSRWDNKQTSPVGSFQANPFGLYDMSGDVWSWTQDCYASDSGSAAADGSASTAGDCGRRVLRGGSWLSGPGILRSAHRLRVSPGYRGSAYGFRVARAR